MSQPENNTIFALRPTDGDRMTVTVRYEIDSRTLLGSMRKEAALQTQVCMTLEDSEFGVPPLLPFTCFVATADADSKTLTDVPVGSFNLNLVLRDPQSLAPLVNSKSVLKFSVKQVAAMLPEILVTTRLGISPIRNSPKRALYAATRPGTRTTNVVLDLDYSVTLLPLEDFDVCVQLHWLASGREALKLTCFPSSQRSLALQTVTEGAYIISLALAQSQAAGAPPGPPNVYEGSREELELHVRALQDRYVRPTLVLRDESIDVALPAPDAKAEALIAFSINSTAPNMEEIIQACLEIHTEAGPGTNAMLLVPLTCVPRGDSHVTVAGLGQGHHTVRMFLRLADEPFTPLPGTDKPLAIEVRAPAEFVPDYDWKWLRPWHTIPAGLESRSALARVLAPALAPVVAVAGIAVRPLAPFFMPVFTRLSGLIGRNKDRYQGYDADDDEDEGELDAGDIVFWATATHCAAFLLIFCYLLVRDRYYPHWYFPDFANATAADAELWGDVADARPSSAPAGPSPRRALALATPAGNARNGTRNGTGTGSNTNTNTNTTGTGTGLRRRRNDVVDDDDDDDDDDDGDDYEGY